jgi:N4-gp56 family major capsid protein
VAITGTAELSNEVKIIYDADYEIAAQSNVYWDQLCDPKQVDEGQRGQTVSGFILENTNPNTSPLNEKEEVVGQTLSANEWQVSIQEFGGTIEVTRFLAATAYVDVYQQAAYANGYNLAETFDLLARAVAGQGSRRFFNPAAGISARSAIAGRSTASHRISASFLEWLNVLARTSRMPLFQDNTVVCPAHPFVYYDLLQSTDIRQMSQFQHPDLLFNGEIAMWSSIRFILSANAKVFYGAGAATALAINTTLAAANDPGDATLVLTNAAGIVPGMWINIVDAVETGNTWYDTNELFHVLSVNGNEVTGFALDPGPGDAGGLRFAHNAGTAVTDRNAVYPLVLMGPRSVTKAYSSFTGPYGESVVTGPFDKLGRFLNFGWYAMLGYTRTRSSWVLRGEVGSSMA